MKQKPDQCSYMGIRRRRVVDGAYGEQPVKRARQGFVATADDGRRLDKELPAWLIRESDVPQLPAESDLLEDGLRQEDAWHSKQTDDFLMISDY